MSDVMMTGIATMPYELAMSDELSRRQFYTNTQRLVAALEAAQAEVDALRKSAERRTPMRREICGECDSPISDDGACDCTELLKHGWRRCAVGQRTTQWCAQAEEQRRRDEELLRIALAALRSGGNTEFAAALIAQRLQNGGGE